jgi:hypothetical protein
VFAGWLCSLCLLAGHAGPLGWFSSWACCVFGLAGLLGLLTSWARWLSVYPVCLNICPVPDWLSYLLAGFLALLFRWLAGLPSLLDFLAVWQSGLLSWLDGSLTGCG